MSRHALRLTYGAVTLCCLLQFQAAAQAQYFGPSGKISERINHCKANLFGGANCGRTLSQADAEALWSDYCYEDCTLNATSSCGGFGGCFQRRGCSPCGGRLGGHGSGTGCGNLGSGNAGCGDSSSAHGGCLGLRSGRHGGGFLSRGCGGVGGDGCGCNLGCFGWPAQCGCGTGCDSGCDRGCGNAAGGLFQGCLGGHRGSGLFQHHHAGCDDAANCGGCRLRHRNFAANCGCDREGFADHHQAVMGGIFDNLHRCGCRGGLFHRHGMNHDACSPISSCVGHAITNSCGCDGN